MKNLLITIAAVLLVGCGPSVPDISIHQAAEDGNIEAVKQHLAAGTDVNAKDKDNIFTPLDMADDKGTADLLRKHGGKTAAWLDAGESILAAASAGHVEAIKKHLAAGADVNAKDDIGSTSLHWAVYYNHKEIAELLIEKGAGMNEKNNTGATPLHFAIQKDDNEYAELLIEKGADMNARNNKGETPLDLEIYFGNSETFDLLRKHGAKTGFWFRAEESINKAAGGGHIEAVKQHLSNGADVHEKDDLRRTPLHGAAIEGHKKIAELLITKGANVNLLDRFKKTPLDYATDPDIPTASAEIADLLRKHGAKTAEELKAEGK